MGLGTKRFLSRRYRVSPSSLISPQQLDHVEMNDASSAFGYRDIDRNACSFGNSPRLRTRGHHLTKVPAE
jgi:hypothetical protein